MEFDPRSGPVGAGRKTKKPPTSLAFMRRVERLCSGIPASSWVNFV
ncbi:hypothetical protein RGUI_2225 [Rhodovulum sp. P5]|nr:hypothetical protein RGUI_2225 [Rhodovulum sp. P5]